MRSMRDLWAPRVKGGAGLLNGGGPHVGPVEPVVAAVEGGGVVAKQTVDHLHRFAKTPHALSGGRELDAEAAVLALGVAGADAELEAPAGYVVDGHRALREQTGMAEGVAAHEHADPDPLGLGGERREQGPALVVGAGLVAGLVEVVAVPDAVESERLEVSPASGQGVKQTGQSIGRSSAISRLKGTASPVSGGPSNSSA